MDSILTFKITIFEIFAFISRCIFSYFLIVSINECLNEKKNIVHKNFYIQPGPSMTFLVYSDPSKTVYSDPPNHFVRITINRFRRITINQERH